MPARKTPPEAWVDAALAALAEGGPEAIRIEVLAASLGVTKGVDNDVITAVLGGINAGVERDRAEQLVRAKLRRETLGDDDAKVNRRLVAMLARRGYDQTLAYDVVSAEVAAERERRRV